MINYLLSGIDKEKGFKKELVKYLKKDIKKNSNIVFIATTFNNYERNDIHYNLLLKLFNDINIKFKRTSIIDNRTTKEESIDLIKESNIIFLMGGDTNKQMNSIIEYNLTNYIKKVDLVIGVSAGSINQSKNIVFLDEYNNNTITKYKGLGLIDFNIYPHFEFTDIDILKETFEVSKHIPLIALPNDSFIRVENNNIEYIGDHYFISDNTIDIKGKEYDPINHIGTIELESERLLYRRTTLEDIEEFFYIQLNPKLRKYLGSTKLGNNPDKNKKYFDESKYNELDYYRWTIVKKEDNKILGTIYLNMHDEKAKTAGIDYWIREDEWSKGYVTEASKCILEFAFNKLDLNRIESMGAKDNPGTWKVMEKIGLKYEGTRKESFFYYYGGIEDMVMYGLSKEGYMKNKKVTMK